MRSVLTLFLFGISLSGCALPEGRLIAATSTDAGPRARDAGPADATVAIDAASGGHGGRGGAGGAAGNAHTAGQGGTGGHAHDARAEDAEDAGSSNAPKANGEACAVSADCASGNCKTTPEGRRCYGLIAVDRACTGMYDCDGYACIPTTADGKNGVCVDTAPCSSKNACARDYWAATCQLDQVCSARSSSFNQCYQKACTRPPDSESLCMSELSIAKSLIASRCCPPAGAYHSSCDTSPQCGCAEGDKCDIGGADGQTSCGPSGSLGDLDECNTNRDCMAGFFCTTSGCNRYCDGPDDRSCSPSGACRPVMIQKSKAPGLFACTHTCDPTSPYTANGPFGACRSDQRCEPAADGFSDCFNGDGGTGRQGASCNNSAMPDNFACAPGYACVSGILTCAKYCKVAANDCEVGTCVPDAEKKYAYDVEIGFCKT